MKSKPFLTSKTGRILWALVTLTRIIIQLPFLLPSFQFRSRRPHPRYTPRQCLAHHLLRIWFEYASAVEFAFPQSLEPGAEKERWATVPTAEDEFYRRNPLLDAEVRPAMVGGTWYPRKYERPSDRHETVILHFHGGGFLLSNARDINCAASASTLIRATSAMVFFVEYRLSSSPNGRFPAALQDAVTAYRYILDLDVPPSQIILSGDSAGGNLALGLLRYIGENADLFPHPPPSAALLWSPWLDLTVAPDNYATHPNFRTDYLPRAFISWALRAYPGRLPPSHPYISPSRHPFPTTTPIWLSVGTLEVLRDQGVEFASAMEGMRGNRVGLCELSDVGHDTFLTAHLSGRQDKAEEEAADAARFLRSVQRRISSDEDL